VLSLSALYSHSAALLGGQHRWDSRGSTRESIWEAVAVVQVVRRRVSVLDILYLEGVTSRLLMGYMWHIQVTVVKYYSRLRGQRLRWGDCGGVGSVGGQEDQGFMLGCLVCLVDVSV
jgi:hypothetical protein